MNILYINHYAGGPRYGMEYRPYYLAREWVRLGHRVQVVAAAYSHLRTTQPKPGSERVDGVEYRWLRAPVYSGNGVGRAWNIAAFLLGVWRQARSLVREFQPQVVIASSTYPLDIYVARRIARMMRPSHAKLVYEVHDLWPLSPIELTGMSPGHPFARLCQWAEDAAYRDADVVVSMLPRVHDHMAAHGLDLARLHIVPNGVADDDWACSSTPLRADVAQAIAALRASGRSVIGYAGAMGLPNALDTLLDAARLVQDAPVGIVMVGDGHERERLARRLAQETIAHVVILPPIAKNQIPAFLQAIDAAYIGWQRSPIYRFGISPNKLMDYMMAGCAVLHSVEAGNDPVAESGCGISVPAESPAQIAEAIRKMIALGGQERRAMGARGREFVMARHTYAVLARRFIEALTA